MNLKWTKKRGKLFDWNMLDFLVGNLIEISNSAVYTILR